MVVMSIALALSLKEALLRVTDRGRCLPLLNVCSRLTATGRWSVARLKHTFVLNFIFSAGLGPAGDDTDSHVDTLARFCSPDTIAYVQCTDTQDEHYEALQQMEEQLKTFRTANGTPYRLLPLPMVDKIEEDGERLPATYAKFLNLNSAVLYPTYGQQENDARAKKVLQEAFPNYEIIGIDCRALIKQHGSLHCVTMQYPVGVLTSDNS